MRFLLRGRKAIASAIEAARITEAPRFTEAARNQALAPFRLVGMNDDGSACYED